MIKEDYWVQDVGLAVRPLGLQAYEDSCNLGAVIIRIGFGDPLFYKYSKEPPK